MAEKIFKPGESKGVPGDDGSRRPPRDPEAQLAVMNTHIAELIANGQALVTFGDNLFVDLDLSAAKRPTGTRIQVGRAGVLRARCDRAQVTLSVAGRSGAETL